MPHNQPEALAHIEYLVDTLFEEIMQKESEAFRALIGRTHIRVLWDSPEHDRYGDFFGTPISLSDEAGITPPDIVIYAEPLIEHFGLHGPHITDQVKKTLMHEIGHFLGLDHEELKKRGWA